MNKPQSLAAYFSSWAAGRPARLAVADAVGALAAVSIELAELLGQGALAGPLGQSTGKRRDADVQKEIDVLANNRILDMLRTSVNVLADASCTVIVARLEGEATNLAKPAAA